MYESNNYPMLYDMSSSRPNGNIKAARFQAIKEHLFSQLNDEAVILSLKNGKYYGLNPVGVVIWTKIQEAATLAEIESALVSEYEVDEETCRREVAMFLETMISEELVESIDETHS